MVYQFKIKLKDISKPPVWRRVEVPALFNFMDFNKVIQLAFGWQNAHLWNFTDRKDMFGRETLRIAEPSEYDGDYDAPTTDAAKVTLMEIFGSRKSLTYVYDFGDYWIHEIIVEGVLMEERPVAFCTEGKGATPPEDCGGVGGYEALKMSFETNDSEVKSYREWLGMKKDETWNPADFNSKDLRYINSALLMMRED